MTLRSCTRPNVEHLVAELGDIKALLTAARTGGLDAIVRMPLHYSRGYIDDRDFGSSSIQVHTKTFAAWYVDMADEGVVLETMTHLSAELEVHFFDVHTGRRLPKPLLVTPGGVAPLAPFDSPDIQRLWRKSLGQPLSNPCDTDAVTQEHLPMFRGVIDAYARVFL